MPDLPQSFYDDLANASLSVVNAPAGTWTVPATAPVVIARSSVTVNFAGCVLETIAAAAPWGNQHYPVKVWSNTNSTGNPGGRFVSRLTGQITPTTTSLTMSEVVTVTPGETVLIHAGVNLTDPAEPETYIVAEVASVSGSVITFSQPLGKSVAVYGSLAELEALTGPSNAYKLGPWGQVYSGLLFSKGIGLDHGMERFTGGMLHDVTINDLTIQTSYDENISTFPNGNWLLSFVATYRARLNRMNVINCTGSAVHLWRTFDTQVDGVSLSGDHLGKVWNTNFFAAAAFTIWGGDQIDISNTRIRGRDAIVVNQEVSPDAVTFRGVDVDVEFTSRRNYASPSQLLGLYAARRTPVVRDASLRMSGSNCTYYSLNQIDFVGTLEIQSPRASNVLFYGYGVEPSYSFEQIVIDGRQFSSPKTRLVSVELVSNGWVLEYQMPPGIYETARIRGVSAVGGAVNVIDGYGNNYTAAISGTSWVGISSHWQQLGVSNSVDQYVSASKFIVTFGAGTTGQVTRFEVEYTYHPEVFAVAIDDVFHKSAAQPGSPAADRLYAWLSRNGYEQAVSDTSGALAFRKRDGVLLEVFATAGTFAWTKATGAKVIRARCISGGGGGGSGRKGAAGSVRCGGPSGSGGHIAEATFPAAAVPSSGSIVVGAGGAGGAAQTTNSTDGNAGTNGGVSQFCLSGGVPMLQAAGGTAASTGGTATGGTGGFTGNGGWPNISGVTSSPGGANANNTGGAGFTASASSGAPCGGGGGGGLDAANTVTAGGGGGAITSRTASVAAGANSTLSLGGGGGAGGASSHTGNAVAGGNGGLYGGGGGGGGAATDSVGNSGAGGNGASGLVMVWTYF